MSKDKKVDLNYSNKYNLRTSTIQVMNHLHEWNVKRSNENKKIQRKQKPRTKIKVKKSILN